MFFDNRDIREEFFGDDHYVGSARNRLALSFCVVIDCYKGYMIFVRPGDEEHLKPVWLAKHQRSKCALHIFRVGHQRMFQMNNGLSIRTNLDKHIYHTLCLEITQRFQIRDNNHLPKTYRFCQRQLDTYCCCKKQCR